MMQNRRKFIKRTTIASLAIATAPFTLGKLHAASDQTPKGVTILFQGDSITDAGRAKDRYYANLPKGMGLGYVYQAAAKLVADNPTGDYQIYNRGISGHKVNQLAARWKDDTLMIKPDVLSILIGINDYWHMVNGKFDGSAKRYETEFRALLERTKKELPAVKLIICEPFAVWGGSAITDRWKKELPAYQQAAAKLANEFDAAFVPFQKVFDKALKQAPASVWCPDGVHPSPSGAHLMANAWITEFNKLY